MSYNKAFWVIFAVLFLQFDISAFALEEKEKCNIYPDFAYEFTGADKCEGFNRKLFVFNLRMNKYIVRPINTAWASVMPKCGMDRFKNVYENVQFPLRAASCALQKNFKGAGAETASFLINSTIGLGGMFTPAQTKFKIEHRDEDFGQVLAHYNVKSGSYIVLPVVRGNVRDLVGKLIGCPFSPTMYLGPFGAAVNALFAVNNTTYSQPLFKKIDENYPDPYEIARLADGIERFIKNENLDRSDVFKEKTASQNIIKVSKLSSPAMVKADVQLDGFNPQDPLTDSMRTSYYDNQKIDSSIWAEVSPWNKTFKKTLKTSSVIVFPNRAPYVFKYLLQKSKSSPLAILYPSIGEGLTSEKSTITAKLLYDKGYSVIIESSPFYWEFLKSMPEGYAPGLPQEDSKYLRLLTSKIIEYLETKKNHSFEEKILVGTSFGALTGLFTAAQEAEAAKNGEKIIGISNYIAINPPVDIFFSLRQLDKYSQDWKKDSSDMKMKAAITVEKVVQVANQINQKEIKEMPENLPFTEDEAKLVISILMKQKLSDLIFTLKGYKRCQRCDICEISNKTTFYDYSKEFLFDKQGKTQKDFEYETTLYSIANYLQTADNYKIYHTLDDYFTNSEQLLWLKNICRDKAVYYSNGSHLGFLYRKEFLTSFEQDITINNKVKTIKEENPNKLINTVR